MSVKYKEVLQWAEEYDKKLLCTDPRFRQSVLLYDEDGTMHFIQYGFVVLYKDYYCVFGEHIRPIVNHKDEVVGIKQFEQIYEIEEIE